MTCFVWLRQTIVWPLLVILGCRWMLLASQSFQAVAAASELGGAFGAASLFVDTSNTNNNNLILQEDTQDEIKEQNQQRQQQEEGSWLHWWSYDGISGPEYWSINKRWRLCSLGRKQSPIDIEPERLVYDHLLGPLKLSWLPAGGSSFPAEEAGGRSATEGDQEEEEGDQDGDQERGNSNRKANIDGNANASEDEAKLRKQPEGAVEETTSNSQSKQVKVQLFNSGRGIEVWLEGMPTSGRQHQQPEQEEQLILSQGPLSYAYKLFKIELHSAAKSSFSSSGQLAALPTAQQLGGSTLKSSEHTISGRAFDAELQLHFYNKHLASNVIEAQQHLSGSPASLSAAGGQDARPNLFAAISVFLLAVDSARNSEQHHHDHKSNNSSTRNEQLDKLDFVLDNLAAIPNQGNSIELQVSKRRIEALITSRRQYITYQGSLNRPPCAEGVDWILLNKALRVDGQKLQGLFVSEKLNTNQENVRPVKPLNGRLLRTTISLSPAAKSRRQKSKSARRPLKKVKQQQTLSSGAGCQEIGSNANKIQQNCTAADLDENQQLNLGRKPTGRGELRQQQQQPCSMKPNFVYQLGSEFDRATKQQQQQQFRQEL